MGLLAPVQCPITHGPQYSAPLLMGPSTVPAALRYTNSIIAVAHSPNLIFRHPSQTLLINTRHASKHSGLDTRHASKHYMPRAPTYMHTLQPPYKHACTPRYSPQHVHSRLDPPPPTTTNSSSYVFAPHSSLFFLRVCTPLLLLRSCTPPLTPLTAM